MAEFNNLLDQLSVLQRRDLSATEKLVACVLLSFRNSESGRCNPSIFSENGEKETVCTRASLTRKCVINSISNLEKKNILKTTKEIGKPTNYQFVLTRALNTPVNDIHPCTTYTPPVYDVHPTRVPSTPHPCTSYTHNKEITNKEQISNKEDGDETLTSPTSQSDCCKSKKQNNRGTSFNLETIPEDWKNVAEELDPDLDPEKLFEEFADYWRAVPGERGRKKDWLATFRNHIRNLPDWKRKNFRKTNSYREPETREPDFSKIDYGESGLLSDFKF